MHIDLDEGRFANAAEAVDLTGLDDENVAAACLEFLRLRSRGRGLPSRIGLHHTDGDAGQDHAQGSCRCSFRR
jgi:hypothetical protein